MIGTEAIREMIEAAILQQQEIHVSDLDRFVPADRSAWVPVFRHHTGVNPGDYIRFFRLRCVCIDLANTELSFSKIADRHGKAAPQLARDFKRVTGYTPGEFRDMTPSNQRRFVRRIPGIYLHNFETLPPSIREHR